MQTKMRAITLRENGGPEVLQLSQVAAPRPQAGELLVRVKATALNRADLLQRRGLYPPPPGETDILGLEMAGIVEMVGADVTGWKVGDRVCALLPGGGYAEQVVIPAGMAIRLPANWNFIDAAAIPEVFLTAYLNLVWLGQMQAGQKVLIHAGASGVGTAAIQLVRALGGQALVTAGSKEKLERCQQLGAAAGWNYKGGSGSEESAKARSFVDFVKLQTDGDGVDLVLDFIGAPYFSDNLASLARGGKLVIIGTMGGANVKEFPLSDVLMRSLQVVGTTLRGQSLADKIRLTQEFSEFAMPLFATGQLKPIVDSVYPWTEAADAHRYMEANRNMGKIVLEITSKANEAGGKR